MAPPPTLQTITIDRLSPAAVLFSYNQPKISNAFTIQQYIDLRDALIWARDDPDITVIVQYVHPNILVETKSQGSHSHRSGKGKHYCAGKVLTPPSAGGPTIEQEIEAGGKLGEVLQSFPKILIAAVHGAAIGWGCTQLTNFDLVYASPSAFFQTPFTQLGFTPEGGSSYTFPRLMGRQHANRFLVASERVSAEEAYVSGLVTKVLPEEAFLEQVCEIAKRIGVFGKEGLRVTKDLVKEGMDRRGGEGVREREAVALKKALNSEETRRRMAEFVWRSKKSTSKL